MGYTHYYDISAEFDKIAFGKVAADFKKMITPLKHLGVILADGLGENYPTISPTEITFNGLEKCGHTKRDLGITWPSDVASGISTNKVDCQLQELTKSQWFAGATLETRACDGDCSHETFSLEQKLETTMTRHDGSTYELEPKGEEVCYTNPDGTKNKTPDNEVGKYFQCTKTAFKPYDLAVTVCLVIAKHYLGEQIDIRSDGSMENWHEAMQMCHHFLGYGRGFCLDDEKSVPLDNTDAGAMTSTYNKNTKEIATLTETQKNLETGNIEKINAVKERYDSVISELNNQRYIETEKIRDTTNTAEETTKTKVDELSSPIHQTERIIYYLKRHGKTPDQKCFDSVKNLENEHLELLEKYSDDCMSLQMFLTENGRPTNKYSLAIVGHSILGGSRYNDEKILELPHGYFGWRNNFDISGENIKIDAKQFKTIDDAKKYCIKNNIKTILKKFFVQYDVVKSEYDEAISKYTISNFEEIIRERLLAYFKRSSYRESEIKETAEKLGIKTNVISEMSFDQVLALAERYGV